MFFLLMKIVAVRAVHIAYFFALMLSRGSKRLFVFDVVFFLLFVVECVSFLLVSFLLFFCVLFRGG